jgi:hypothetical protein
MTGLTYIGSRHANQLNSFQQTLIGKKLSELVKIPFADLASKFLAFILSRKANLLRFYSCRLCYLRARHP